MIEPGISKCAHAERIDSTDNAILLSHLSHIRFARLHFWFSEVSIRPDSRTYKLESVPNRIVFRRDSPPPEYVTFRSNGEYLTPNPIYLAFHRALAKAAFAVDDITDYICMQTDEGTDGVLSPSGADAGLLQQLLLAV